MKIQHDVGKKEKREENVQSDMEEKNRACECQKRRFTQ